MGHIKITMTYGTYLNINKPMLNRQLECFHIYFLKSLNVEGSRDSTWHKGHVAS